MPLNAHQIAASLGSHWATQEPLPIATIYPGQQADTTTWTEWQELWIDSWSRPTQRIGQPRLCDLIVTVHLFVRYGLNPGGILQLAETARTKLEHLRLDITDRDLSGHPSCGQLQLYEATLLDLTRHEQEEAPQLQHLILRVPGLAQET